jgi:TatD DNase family protein
MNISFDIHTHRYPTHPGEVILNCYPDDFHPDANGWYSVGIHPWIIDSGYTGRVETHPLSVLFAEHAQHPRVLTIGEAGVDKLAKAEISLQEEFFKYQARLADDLKKPLIIHAVRSSDSLLRLKRELSPSEAWIIHGFRGKPELAEEYLNHGFYLSLGERYQKAALNRIPLDRLFLETDESPLPIELLYEQVADDRNLSVDMLREVIAYNVSRVFFKS